MTSPKSPQQLSLEVSLRDDATFDNYFLIDENRLALHAIKNYSENTGDQSLLLWGSSGCGLTHLLQACNHRANLLGFNIQYIQLNDVLGFPPERVLEGLDVMDLICLDGLESICGNREWEQGLFHFYNRLKDNGRRLLMASHVSPNELTIQLADLKSRVCGSVVYHIQALNDDGKAKALQMRSSIRGMEMSDEVANFILSRTPRDSAKLFDLLDLLDTSTLQQKRKLSIPFVKSILFK